MPASAGSPYLTNRYRVMRRAFIAAAEPFCAYSECPVPGRFVDKSLSGRHPLGPTVDHVVPTALGGSFWDLSNWALCHRRCNNAKSWKPPVRDPEPHSERWWRRGEQTSIEWRTRWT
jgi:5-methylcytosine-specific restriction endonuclease McrA